MLDNNNSHNDPKRVVLILFLQMNKQTCITPWDFIRPHVLHHGTDSVCGPMGEP